MKKRLKRFAALSAALLLIGLIAGCCNCEDQDDGESTASSLQETEETSSSASKVKTANRESGTLSASVDYSNTDADIRSVSYEMLVLANISRNSEMAGVQINNIKLKNRPKGSLAILAPQSVPFVGTPNPYAALDDIGESIIFKVTENTTQENIDEVYKHWGTLRFKVQINNAYTFSSNEALKLGGMMGSKSFQYANASPSELDNELSFDVEITLADGSQETISFVAPIDGQILYDTGLLSNIEFQVQ